MTFSDILRGIASGQAETRFATTTPAPIAIDPSLGMGGAPPGSYYGNDGVLYGPDGSPAPGSPGGFGYSPNQSEALGAIGIGVPVGAGGGGGGGDDLANRDALARLRSILDRYGLGSLADWLWQRIVAGDSDAMIMQALRERPEYKLRFPGMDARRAAGYSAISEEEYLAFETGAAQLFRAYGLPGGFWDDPGDYAALIGNNVSISELNGRVRDGFARVANFDPLARAAFATYFGAQGDAALASLFLDHTKALPVLERMVNTALMGGTAERFGIHLGQPRAEQIAALGYDAAGATSRFQQVFTTSPLYRETISERTDLRAEEEGVAAAFGLDASSQQAIEDRLKQRIATTQGGGGAGLSREGLAVGAASRG